MKLELKIVGLLSKEKNRTITINQIAKELKMAYSFVNRKISQMISQCVVIKKTAGHSILCKLNFNNDKTKALLYSYEVEKKLKLFTNRKYKLVLNDLEEKLRIYDLLCSVIFGSVAKQNKRANDIDLLVIAKKKTSLSKVVKEIYAEHNLELNPVIMTLTELKKQKSLPLIKEIISGHVVVNGFEIFIEEVLS